MEKKKMILLAGGASVVCTVVICVILILLWLFNQEEDEDSSTSTGTSPGTGAGTGAGASTRAGTGAGASTRAGTGAGGGCIGYWTPCSPSCGGSGLRTFVVERGTSCKDPDSTSSSPIPAGRTKVCVTRPCYQDCVGSWSGFGQCSATCGLGTRSNVFTVSTSAGMGGMTCMEKYGPDADINYGTKVITQSCDTNIPCTTPVNCVQRTIPGQCSVPCGTGTKQDIVITDQYPSNGGTACPLTEGLQPLQACDTGLSCCNPDFLEPWTPQGLPDCDPLGTGSSMPQRLWTRRFNTGVVTPSACALSLTRIQNTTASCPPRTPISGTCVNGYSWNNTTKLCEPNSNVPGSNPRSRPRNADELNSFNRNTNNGLTYDQRNALTDDQRNALPYGPNRWLDSDIDNPAGGIVGYRLRFGPNSYFVNEPARLIVDCPNGTSQIFGQINCETIKRQSNVVSLTCPTGFGDADLNQVVCRGNIPDNPPNPND